jgi:type IX secretion system PorP/SprF family membrane protein
MKRIILWIFVALTGFKAMSQDIHFSQAEQSVQYINPALMGSFEGTHRGILTYRTQWSSVMSAYKTLSAQYDGRYSGRQWRDDAISFGLSFFSDEAGAVSIKSKQLNWGFGYIKTLGKANTLSAAIQMGWASRSIDQTAARWDNQYDPSQPDAYNPNFDSRERYYGNSFSFLDLNMGLLWVYQNFRDFKIKSGFSIYHISPVDLQYYTESNEVLDRRWNAHLTLYKRMKGSNVTLMPNVLFMNQGAVRQTVLGLQIRYAMDESSRYTGTIQDMYLEFGGHYRFGDAFILSMAYSFKNFNARVSYDLNTSKLSLATKGAGGLEFSLTYTTPYTRKYRAYTRY